MEATRQGTIPIAQIGAADSDVWSVGDSAATGLYTKDWYFNNPKNEPEDKVFAAGPYDFLDIQQTLPASAAGLDALYGTKNEVGCNMGSL